MSTLAKKYIVFNLLSIVITYILVRTNQLNNIWTVLGGYICLVLLFRILELLLNIGLAFLRFAYNDFLGNSILINATVYFRYGILKHFNLGDDLNFTLLQILTKKHISILRSSFLKYYSSRKRPDYLVIGSTITFLTTPHTIIWGAGVIDNKEPLKVNPCKVLAVRGPLTRKYLLEHGVYCPEVYGDPGLLVSKVYRPNVQKKYKYGFVPHYLEFNNPIFDKFKKDSNCLFIRMSGYDNWKSVMDMLNSCDYIISSSLHGLIFAESYSIPSLWIQVTNNIRGGAFKYKDYYASIGLRNMSPFVLKDNTTIKDIEQGIQSYKSGTINLEPLVKSAPFTLIFNK